jgi:transposase-like protein
VLHAGQRVDHVLDGGRGAAVAAEHGAKLFVLSEWKRARRMGGGGGEGGECVVLVAEGCL